ncbi:MAG: transposase [Myxococcales bacterium]|nr:transposase [Myxococcales bacterium]
MAQQVADQVEADAEAAEQQEGEAEDHTGANDEKPHRPPRKPTGRSTASPELQKVVIRIVPEEVQRLGSDALECVGEERTTTIERRKSALVEVTTVYLKYRAKTEEAEDAVKAERAARGTLPEEPPKAWITRAPAIELPIERGMAGPGLLANLIVRRFDDHLPYNWLESVFEREGMRLGRSTLYGWLDQLRDHLRPLVEAMWLDSLKSPYVCIDATGVLVQALEKCSRGHFWVLVAPGRHVIFSFSRSHDSAAVDKLLADYKGFIVADAHSVYDHLFCDEGASEVACWSHARKCFFKATTSEAEIGAEFLSNLRIMFLLERKFADKLSASGARKCAEPRSRCWSTGISTCAASTRTTPLVAHRWLRPSATRSTRSKPCGASSTMAIAGDEQHLREAPAQARQRTQAVAFRREQ